MLRTIPTGLKMLVLIAMLTSAPTVQAQMTPFGDAAIREAVSRHVRSSATVRFRRVPRRVPCNLKGRVLAGAVIGAALGMVIGNKVGESATDTLGTGAVGAALGAGFGLHTWLRACR
jgi:uncharacterized protein YcfJ